MDVTSKDFERLGQIHTDLSAIAEWSGASEQLRSSASSATQKLEAVILGDLPFEEGIGLAAEAIELVRQAAMAQKRDEPSATSQTGQATLSEVADPELLNLFLSQQASVLEDFESAILALEKGEEEARDQVKRILHTWKGEAGALGLNSLGKLVHDVEDLVVADDISIDRLLELKDYLEKYFASTSPEAIPPVDEQVAARILGEAQPQDEAQLLEATHEASKGETKEGPVVEASEPSAEGGESQQPAAKDTAEEAPSQADQAQQQPTTEAGGESAAASVPDDDYDIQNIDFEGDRSLIEDFISEANDHIQNAETALLDLEENPDDAELINTIFRAFHTIKGVAGFLSLKPIGNLAHASENLLDLVRKGKIRFTPEHSDVLFAAIDVMKNLVASLTEALSGGSFVIPENFPKVKAAVLAAVTGSAPPSSSEREIADRSESVASTKESTEADREPAESKPMAQAAAVSPTPERPKAGTEAMSGAQLSVVEGSPNRETRGPEAPEPQLEMVQGSTEQAPSQQQGMAPKKKAIETTVKVSTQRLDALIDMVGELVIAHSMIVSDETLARTSSRKLASRVSHTSKIVRDLQELSMALRMVSVKSIFQKMSRIVRDLARKSGKKIEFTMSGEDTELDRNVVDRIADPLVHMIRNAVDHGIEPPEERKAASKPEVGHIHLKAYHRSGNVVIEVHDDGRGLNREKILKKAIRAGLVSEGEDLSPQQIDNLIFQPGLSTADKVTEVSGRGVGMDVVKKNIEALRGRVEISSTPGKGCVFSMRLPLTLAIIDGMVVRVGEERYVVPTLSIVESVKPTAEALSTITGRGEMMSLRGELLPLFRLAEVFGVPGGVEDPTEGIALIIEADNQRCAILIDQILDQQQVVIKSLSESLGKVPGVSGAAILGDGTVGLIIDASGLIALAQGKAA